MNAKQLPGIALLIIGVLMVSGAITPFAGAMVIYDAPVVITPLNPSGTVNAPTPYSGGAMTSITASVTGVPSNANVKIYNSNNAQVWTSTMGLQGSNLISNSYWTVPTALMTYRVEYSCTDPAGTTITATSYCVVTDAIPQGNFYINGIQMSPSTVIRVTNPVLAIEFVALQNGQLVTLATVKLYNYNTSALLQTKTLNEYQSNLRWNGSITLPNPGTYKIDGIISDSASGRQWTLMSTLATLPGDGSGPTFGINQIVGIGLMLIGAYLIRKPLG